MGIISPFIFPAKQSTQFKCAPNTTINCTTIHYGMKDKMTKLLNFHKVYNPYFSAPQFVVHIANVLPFYMTITCKNLIRATRTRLSQPVPSDLDD